MGATPAAGDLDVLLNEQKKVDAFWLAYEDRLRSTLPPELKAVLCFMGYKCKAALQKFDKDDVAKIEKFMVEKLHKLVDESKYEMYYGIFAKEPQLFEIMGGFQRVLEAMVELTNSKSSTFFSGHNKRREEPANRDVISAQQQAEPSGPPGTFEKDVNHLHSMLSKWLEENAPDVEVDYEVLPVTVSRDAFGGLSCRIGCPVAECNTISSGNKKGSRWSHNFYRHMKIHLNRKRNGQGTLCSLIVKKKKSDSADTTANEVEHREKGPGENDSGNTISGESDTQVVNLEDNADEHVDNICSEKKNENAIRGKNNLGTDF